MISKTQKLLIATNNLGKVRELREMLDGLPFELVGLADFPAVMEVEETGLTFDENARLKALGYAMKTGLFSLADDSGLEVEALGNRPGVLSARYGGENSSFAEKMAKLLGELDRTGDEMRRARFVCSMAVADAAGNILHSSEAVCDGRIVSKP
ncbi:MAG: non-canonical purine NTP pyrophosphatase, partial [Pyrinomonadaceae bacterium]